MRSVVYRSRFCSYGKRRSRFLWANMGLTIKNLTDMFLTLTEPAIIVRTERGLVIAGTRITLEFAALPDL